MERSAVDIRPTSYRNMSLYWLIAQKPAGYWGAIIFFLLSRTAERSITTWVQEVWILTTNVPSKFFTVCAEENGVWAARFGAWALQLSHFPKRQFNSKISGGDPEGSALVSTDPPPFWELGLLYDFDPTFCWNRCAWQPYNNCSFNKMFLHLASFPEFVLSSVYMILFKGFSQGRTWAVPPTTSTASI